MPEFDDRNVYRQNGKLYLRSQPVGQDVYDEINRIATAEDVDLGVGLSMYNANNIQGANYGDGTYRQQAAAAHANTPKSYGAFNTQGGTLNYNDIINNLKNNQPASGSGTAAAGATGTQPAATGAAMGAAAGATGGATGTQPAATAFDRKSAGGSAYDQMYFTDEELRSAAAARDAATAGTTDWKSAHDYVEGIRAKYGYSGGDDGSGYVRTGGYAPTVGTANPPGRDNPYETDWYNILQSMANYPEFQFDQNSDPLWGALAKQYRREGQRATQDAMGQYAAMTGGIPSTAAVTAATQAGDYYGAQLTDRLQSVYNDAYQKYLDQYTRLMGLADEYRSGMSFREGQYQTDLGQYNTDRNFDYGKYLDEQEAARLEDQTAYNREQDALDRQYQQERDEYNRSLDDREFKYQQERDEYNRSLDDREFRYQQEKDEYNRSLDDREFKYQQERDEYNRGRTAQADAQERVLSYISMGGDPANIPADILSQSGYSMAELQQMQNYYAQQAALQAAKASGGGSSGGGSRGSGSGSGVAAEGTESTEPGGYADVDVTSLTQEQQTAVADNLRQMFPGGVIDTDDWRVVTQEFDPQWLAANGFTERGMTGEYRAEAEQPAAGYNVGTAIEKAASNYGAAKDFLTRNGASQSVINGLRKQSSLGLDNGAYKQYLRDYIDGFLNGFTTPSYNQTVNDLAAQNPQVSGNVLSMLYTPTR